MIKGLVAKTQLYLQKPWYPFLVAILVGADIFIVGVPNDILIISAALAQPKRWLLVASLVSLGSTLGAAALCGFLYWNPDAIREFFPSIFHSQTWQHIQVFLQQYGKWAMVLAAAGPLPQQPFVVVAALSGMDFRHLIVSVLAGRFIKYFTICLICSRAPHLLKRYWPEAPSPYTKP